MSIPKFIASAVLTVAASSAYAGPTLTFDGSSEGASIQNFYNGGTDSFGNSGGNYGVTFVGGIVHYKNGLSYLTNVSSVMFSTPETFGVSFAYSTPQTRYTAGGSPAEDPGYYDFYIYPYFQSPQISDPQFASNTTSPFCTAFTGQYCIFDGAAIGVSQGQTLTGFSFSQAAAIDTITLGSRTRPATVMAQAAQVPEPATFALFTIGLLGLGALRRKHG